MMKKICYFLLTILAMFNCIAESINYKSMDSGVKFQNGNVRIWKEDDVKETKMIVEGAYQINEVSKIPFITVSTDNSIEKMLILKNEFFCVIYNESLISMGYGENASLGRKEDLTLFYANSIRSSSFLVEGTTNYSPKNLNGVIKLTDPWVEGIQGQGINEYIGIKSNNAKRLYISIGYVSYHKPYLYEQNSRPKKIQLSVEGRYSFTYNLEDTPNFQTIDLPQRLKDNDELILTILEVYPGTKYEDTCINSIYYDWVDYE